MKQQIEERWDQKQAKKVTMKTMKMMTLDNENDAVEPLNHSQIAPRLYEKPVQQIKESTMATATDNNNKDEADDKPDDNQFKTANYVHIWDDALRSWIPVQRLAT